jgi:hypothetical protein
VLLEQPYGIAPDRSRDRNEFDYIDATLASFDFCDKRLRLVEPIRQLLLDDAGILPRLLQQGEKASVIRGVKGLAHAPCGGEALSKLILKPDYPKMGSPALLRLDFPPTQSNPILGYL